MAQQTKVLASKPQDPSYILGTEGEKAVDGLRHAQGLKEAATADMSQHRRPGLQSVLQGCLCMAGSVLITFLSLLPKQHSIST